MMIFEVNKLSPGTLFDHGVYLRQFWSYKLDCKGLFGCCITQNYENPNYHI